MGSEPLPGSIFEKQEPAPEWPEKFSEKDKCTVTLLDPARIGFKCCDGNAIVIDAPALAKIEMFCRADSGTFGRPNLKIGTYQGQEVIFFEGGSKAIKLPLRLASREFLPIIIGLTRPYRKRGGGMLKATQQRGDGEFSPGYSIEG